MKAILKIEAIGDNTDQYFKLIRRSYNDVIPGLGNWLAGDFKPSYWVAEILGSDKRYKWQRRFLRGKKDYSEANSKGSRGVYVYYTLESGHIYEVNECVTWKRNERYFCRVTLDGDIETINEDEVRECLKKELE